jgi:uncharacterized 2Fe-2S/4Fe-4S cluster protein (DUF4445 family)
VAGAFGCFIDPRSAIAIGMLPDLPLERYVPHRQQLARGRGPGADRPRAAVEEIDRIRDRITYLELNVNQEFMNRFSAAKFLPHTDLGRFPFGLQVQFRRCKPCLFGVFQKGGAPSLFSAPRPTARL